MSRGSGVCSHVAPGVCSSFASRDSFPAGACPYPKAQRCLRRRLFYQHQKRQCARNLVERRSTLFLCFSLSWARAKLPWPSLIRKVCPAMFGLEVSGHLRCARTLPLDALFDIICYSDALRPLSVFSGDVWTRDAAHEPNQGLPLQMGCYRLLCNVAGGGNISSSAHRIATIHCSPLASPSATHHSILAAAEASGCVALAVISSLPPPPSPGEAHRQNASLVCNRHPVLAAAVSRHVMLERQRLSHVKCFQESASTSPDFDFKVVMVAASFEGTPPPPPPPLQ